MSRKRNATKEAIIEKGRRALFDLIRKRRQFQHRQMVDRAKRVAAASLLHRALIRSIAKNAGQDLAEFDAQRKLGWEKLCKDTERQQKAATALLKQKHKQQLQAFRSVMKNRHRFEYKKGNPHTAVCLWRASRNPNVLTNEETFSDGVFQFVPINAFRNVGHNVVGFTAKVIGRTSTGEVFAHLSPVVESLDLITEHRFEGTAPHDGQLSVTAMYAPLGTIALRAPGDFIFGGTAGINVQLYIRVIISPPQRQSFELPFGETKTIADADLRAGWNDESQLVVIDSDHGLNYQLTHNNVVQVNAGDQIIVIAGYDMLLGASSRGDATATFTPLPAGLNVPMVMLTIDS